MKERCESSGGRDFSLAILELAAYGAIVVIHGASAMAIPEAVSVALILAGAGILRPHALLTPIARPLYLSLVSLAVLSAVFAVEHWRNWISLVLFVMGLTTGFTLQSYVATFGTVCRRSGIATRIAWFCLVTSCLVLLTHVGSNLFARLSLVIAGAYLVWTTSSRGAGLIAMMISLMGAVAADSKVVYASLFASLALASMYRVGPYDPRRRIVNAGVLAGCLAVVVGAAVVIFSPERVADIVRPSESVSTLARAATMLAGIEATLDYPALGLGPAGLNVIENYERYYSDELIAGLIALGEARSHALDYGRGYASGTHNMYLDLSSSYGLPLLMLVLLGLGRAFHVARKSGHAFAATLCVAIGIQGMGWQLAASAVGAMLLGLVLAEARTGRKLRRSVRFVSSSAGGLLVTSGVQGVSRR